MDIFFKVFTVMRISNLCGYLQEVAGRHAEHLDVAYTNMQKKRTGLAYFIITPVGIISSEGATPYWLRY